MDELSEPILWFSYAPGGIWICRHREGPRSTAGGVARANPVLVPGRCKAGGGFPSSPRTTVCLLRASCSVRAPTLHRSIRIFMHTPKSSSKSRSFGQGRREEERGEMRRKKSQPQPCLPHSQDSANNAIKCNSRDGSRQAEICVSD